jgi:cytochrome b subunit of formate dehydrogenase
MILMACVLVYLEFYNKIRLTGWVINNRNLFLTVQEAEKSKIKVSADPVPGAGLSLSFGWHLLAAVSHGKKSKAANWGLINKGTNLLLWSYLLIASSW